MNQPLLQITHLFRPNDEVLTSTEKTQVQTGRLFSLLVAAVLIVIGTVRFALSLDAADPLVSYFGVSGLLVSLCAATYGSRRLRRWGGSWMRGGFYVVMAWCASVAILNGTSGEYVLILLIVYAVLVGAVGLGGRSAQPVWWFAGFGVLVTAIGFALGPAPEVHPLVVLVSMATAAVVVGLATQAHLSIQAYLREQRGQWQHLMENLQEAVMITVGGEIAYANAQAAALFGAESREELENRSVFALVAPESRAVMERRLDRVEENQSTEPFEHRAPGLDGGERVVQSQSVPVQYEGEDAALTVVRDVTHWREAQDALTRRAELRQLIVEISAGFIDTPVDSLDQAVEEALGTVGAFVGADRSYVFLFDGDPEEDGLEETTQSNTHEWCAPGSSSQKDHLQDISCATVPWWTEQMGRKEPLIIPSVSDMPEAAGVEQAILDDENIQSLAALPMTQGEQLVGFVGFDAATAQVDWDEETVTILRVLGDAISSALQRKEMEQRLRDREERLRAITENVSEGIYRSTADEGLVFANQTFAEMFGYESVEEVLEIDPATLYPTPEARQRHRSAAQEQDSFDRVEAEFQRVDDTTFVGLTSGSVVRDENGEVQYYDGAITDITERRKMAERLREREARLRGLANSIPGVAYQFYARPDGTYGTHFVSDHAEPLLGISSESETFFDRFTECVPSSDREAFLDSIDEAVEEESRWRFEIPFDKPSGERIWLLGTSTPERREGELVFHGVLLDITDRKAAEQALQEERDRFETLFESLPTPVVRCTAEGGGILIADVNEAFETVFGVESSEAVGEDIDALLRPEEEEVLGIDREALTEGAVRTDVRCETADGPRDFRIQVAGRKPDTGAPEGHAIYTDITARKRREQALEETNATLEAILENLPSGILAEDGTRSVLAANESFCDLLGLPCSATDLKGRDAPTVVERTAGLFADPDRFVERTRGILDRGRPVFEEELTLTDGRILERDFVPYDLEDATAALWVYRDVTDRKKRERRLREARDEAEDANRMKSAFLANMSHEIRTPLTSIIGFAEAIGDEVETTRKGPIPRFASLIEESGHRLLETLDAVLNLSKLEAGEMGLSPEPVSVADEAEEVVTLFEPQAEEAGIDLQVNTPDQPVRGQADPGGLRIILRNLVSNALKYTRDGGDVRVRARSADEAVALEVEDTGIGMDPEEATALFGAFRQGSEGVAREYEGSGLGLAVTKRVVREMDGTIEVETEKGEGTCFTVRLPEHRNGEQGE